MSTAVLLSGGLDSAVLLVEEAARGEVQPIYVSVGLAWEAAERAMVSAFLAAEALRPGVRPLVTLSLDMRDVYSATHWAVRGEPSAYHTPDEDVHLPGRNIVLLGKAAVSCATSRIDRLLLGSLGHNPFPDATPEFRSAMARALSLGLAHTLSIDAPYASLTKAEVIGRGAAHAVPFTLTLSCMKPVHADPFDPFEPVEPFDPLQPLEPFEPPERLEPFEPSGLVHCGACSKCRERHDAFLEAGLADPTHYADHTFVGH